MTTKEILSTFHLGMQAAPTPSLPSQSSAPVAKGGERALWKPGDQVTALLRCCLPRAALRTGTLGHPRTPRQAWRPRACRKRGGQEPGARARGFPCGPGSPGQLRPPAQHGRLEGPKRPGRAGDSLGKRRHSPCWLQKPCRCWRCRCSSPRRLGDLREAQHTVISQASAGGYGWLWGWGGARKGPPTPPRCSSAEAAPASLSTQAANTEDRASRSGRAHPTYPRSRVSDECRSLSTACRRSPSQRTCSRGRWRWKRGTEHRVRQRLARQRPARTQRASPRPARFPSTHQRPYLWAQQTTATSTGAEKMPKSLPPAKPHIPSPRPGTGEGAPRRRRDPQPGLLLLLPPPPPRWPGAEEAEGEGEESRGRSGPGGRSPGAGALGGRRRGAEPAKSSTRPLRVRGHRGAPGTLSSCGSGRSGGAGRGRRAAADPLWPLRARATTAWRLARRGMGHRASSSELPTAGRGRDGTLRCNGRAAEAWEMLRIPPPPQPYPTLRLQPRPALPETHWALHRGSASCLVRSLAAELWGSPILTCWAQIRGSPVSRKARLTAAGPGARSTWRCSSSLTWVGSAPLHRHWARNQRRRGDPRLPPPLLPPPGFPAWPILQPLAWRPDYLFIKYDYVKQAP